MSNLDSVNNFWTPIGPTDFATPLSKVYQRQSDQDKKEEQNVAEHAQQVEAADSGKVLLATAKSFIDTVSAVKNAANTAEQRGEKKKTKKAVEMENKMAANVTNTSEAEVVKEYVKYLNGSSDIIKGQEDLKKLFGEKKVNERLQAQLLDASAGENLRIQEWQLSKLSIHSKADFEKYISGLNANKEKNAEILGKIAKYQEDHGESYFKKWFIENYAPSFGATTPEAAGALLAPEVNRASKTIEGSAGNTWRAGLLTEGAAKFSETIDTVRKTWGAAGQNGPEMSRAFQSRTSDVYLNKLAELNLPEGTEYSDDQKATARSQAQEQVSNELYALARSGKLTFAEFQGLRNGNIVGHPSGDTADIMLSSKQWAHIEAGITQASNALITNDIAAKKQNIINADAAYRSGEGSLKDVNNAQNSFISAGGDKNDGIYKRSIGYSQGHNTKEAYIEQRKRFEPYISGEKRGSLGNDTGMLAEINAIKNYDLKNELLKQYKEETNRLELSKVPNREQSTKSVKTLLIDQGLDKTLKEDSELSGDLEHMVSEIVEKRNWFFMQQDPADPYAFIKSDKLWQEWLTSNGFYSKGNKDDPNYGGKFSPNKRGKYLKYAQIRHGQIEATRKTDAKSLEQYNANLNLGLANAAKNPVPGKTTKDVFIDTPEAILTRDDIIGAYTVNKGEIFFSEELKIKAHALGMQPSVLLQRQTDAFIRSLDKKDPALENLDLKKLIEDIEIPTGDVIIRDQLITVKDGNLLYAWEFIGPGNASPKLLARTAQALGSLDRTQNTVQAQDRKDQLGIEISKLRQQGLSEEAIRKKLNLPKQWSNKISGT